MPVRLLCKLKTLLIIFLGAVEKALMGRQVSNDVIRSTDATAEIQVETSDITNKFKFFETYREPEQLKKLFRITPPRDGQVKVRLNSVYLFCLTAFFRVTKLTTNSTQ